MIYFRVLFQPVKMSHFWQNKDKGNPVFGGLNREFKRNFLPKNSDVLKCLLRIQQNCDSAKDAYKETAEYILNLWHKKTSLPLISIKSIVQKIKRLHDDYCKLLKDKKNEVKQAKYKEENEKTLFNLCQCKCEADCVCSCKLSAEDKAILDNQKLIQPKVLANTNNKCSNENKGRHRNENKGDHCNEVKGKKLGRPKLISKQSLTAVKTESDESNRILRSQPVPPLTPLPSKKRRLRCIAMVAERYDISDRAASAMVNATLKDFEVANEANIVDRNRLRREKAKLRKELSEDQIAEIKNMMENAGCIGLFFDEKKDLTNVTEKNEETNHFHPKQQMENHCTLVIEPNNNFLGHIVCKGAKSEVIFDSIIAKLNEEQLTSNNILVIGCDGTGTNTGRFRGKYTLDEHHFSMKTENKTFIV